jgi:hypothetical protein
MVISMAREQARLVIRGVERVEQRWGNRPGTFPVGVVSASELTGVGAGASINSMRRPPPLEGDSHPAPSAYRLLLET